MSSHVLCPSLPSPAIQVPGDVLTPGFKLKIYENKGTVCQRVTFVCVCVCVCVPRRPWDLCTFYMREVLSGVSFYMFKMCWKGSEDW